MSIPPPSLLAARPCAECRKPPVRTNRGSLFLSAAGGFRPRLGSMEFGFWGLRRVGREGNALLVPGGQREVAALFGPRFRLHPYEVANSRH